MPLDCCAAEYQHDFCIDSSMQRDRRQYSAVNLPVCFWCGIDQRKRQQGWQRLIGTVHAFPTRGQPVVGRKAKSSACSGRPYTCCTPGKAKSNDIASGPLGLESVWDLNVSSHNPVGSPSCSHKAPG